MLIVSIDLIVLHKLFTDLQLIGGVFVGHVEYLIAGTDIFLGGTVTVGTPAHIQGVLFAH